MGEGPSAIPGAAVGSRSSGAGVGGRSGGAGTAGLPMPRRAAGFRAVALLAAGFRAATFLPAGFLTVIFFRAVGFRAVIFFRAVVFFRAVGFRAVVFFRAALFRAVVFRAVVFRAVVFRAVVFRAVVFRAAVFLAVVLRLVPFLAAVLRDVRFLAAVDLLAAEVFRALCLPAPTRSLGVGITSPFPVNCQCEDYHAWAGQTSRRSSRREPTAHGTLKGSQIRVIMQQGSAPADGAAAMLCPPRTHSGPFDRCQSPYTPP